MNANSSDKTYERMRGENVFKLLLSFSLTTFASLLLNTVYSLTDALFVAKAVGDDAFGGVSIVFPFVIFQSAVATAVGGGAASIVSRKLGAKDSDGAGQTTANAMFVFYSTAIITTVIGFVFMEEVLRIFGVTEELLPFAKSYFAVILAGNVFSTGFSSIIRAEGNMKYSLLIWIIPISVNIALDALFILVFNWGVIGSAAATVVCQFVSFCMSVFFFMRRSKQSFKKAKLSFKTAGEVLSVGLPALIQTASLSVSAIILNNAMKTVAGTVGINAYSYVNKVVTYLIMPLTAFSQALSPIVGFNYGAKDVKRVRSAVFAAATLSLLYSVVVFVPVEIFPEAFLGIFTESPELLSLGGVGLAVVSVALFPLSVTNVIGVTLQTLGKKYAAALAFSSMLVFLIPLSILLPAKLGIKGVWLSYLLANVLSAILAAVIGVLENKKLGKEKPSVVLVKDE